MNPSLLAADRPATRLATRLAFWVAGFATGCWAPLVPYAKARLNVDDATLGLLLLCLGIGSVVVMPFIGGCIGRYGTRRMILAGGVGLCLILPILAATSSLPLLSGALLMFGASLAILDVAMNMHAVVVEREAGIPLMSGFHGLYSVGGFAGAGSLSGLLALGASSLSAAIISVIIMFVALFFTAPRLLPIKSGRNDPFFVRPRGIVLLLGCLAFTAFLTEGAMLDWGAIFLIDNRGFLQSDGGYGYVIFSIAMTAGRLTGDWVVALLGKRRILWWGGLLEILGFAVLLLAPFPWIILSGFLLIGLGAANLVPVLFTADRPGKR